MVEAVLYLFKIHRKVIFGNSSVIVQNMFGKAPKSFNAVDMILAAAGKGLAVIQAVVLAPTLKRVVTAEGVGVINRSFPGMLLDMRHQFIGGNPLHNFGVNTAIALQKAENNAFPGGAASALPLAPATKIRFVNFNFSFELARFKLRHMINRLAQALIDASNCLIIQAEICCHAIGGLLLVKAGKDGDLFAQLFKRFLFSTGLVSAPHISAPSLVYLERAAKNALSAPQKVGRTGENVVSSSNHKGILALDGYESN